MRSYSDVLRSGRTVLTDAATGTRLRFGTPWSPDDHVKAASFGVTAGQTRATGALFASYATIAREFSVLIVLYAPTSRATSDRCRAAGLPAEGLCNVNERCVALLRAVRDRVAHVDMFVAGVLGPAHDAFDVSNALTPAAARAFHEPQARVLVEAGSICWSARRCRPCQKPRRRPGACNHGARVPTGAGARSRRNLLDAATDPPPVHYVIQCVTRDSPTAPWSSSPVTGREPASVSPGSRPTRQTRPWSRSTLRHGARQTTPRAGRVSCTASSRTTAASSSADVAAPTSATCSPWPSVSRKTQTPPAAPLTLLRASLPDHGCECRQNRHPPPAAVTMGG